jgi:hypothetical protein
MRNHLRFKNQEIYLILSIDASTNASMYVCLKKRKYVLYYGTRLKSVYILYYEYIMMWRK